jgi:signal transduction histidine kinase
VVQEALTNALKHAGSAPTEVVLRWGPEALEVVVADRGGGESSPSLPSSGHGIVGMRERVRVYGGSLSAHPQPDGGFVVRARLPLDGSELVVA